MSQLADTSDMLFDVPSPRVLTEAASEDTLIHGSVYAVTFSNDWQKVIDQKLIDWGRDPSQLEEDELIPPTCTAVNVAVAIAKEAKDQNLAPPFHVVPDGDGGIVFERWDGAITESIEISDDGTVELVLCQNRKVIMRRQIP